VSAEADRPRPQNLWLPEDDHWYKKAVFYEVLVRGFNDSNDDGTGDLVGLTEKLDYLAWLGVDCLWLLPFYESPLRDGGYDIADFFNVLPSTARSATPPLPRGGAPPRHPGHRRHGHEPHERRPPVVPGEPARPHNPKADWYVWSDDDSRWSEAAIIFTDTEVSNWTFDPVRGQYYWHRFFHHQPT
jgi:maltose alpha-D-glucosyltransferase/alpha-amylase